MALQASGQISLQDIIQEFTNSTDGTESVLVAASASSGQPTIQTGSTANLCVGMRATTSGVNGTIASLTSGSITMSANLTTTLLTNNEIFFEANALSDFYSGGAIGVSSSGAPNVPTSGEIQLTDFYSASAAIDFPSSTYIVREFDGTMATGYVNIVADDAAFEFVAQDIGQGIAACAAIVTFRIERNSSGFDFDAYGSTGFNNVYQNRIDSSGTSTGIANNTWTEAASGTVQPTSFKWEVAQTVGGTGSLGNGEATTSGSNVGGSTYSVNENTYQSLALNETGGWTASVSASSEIEGQSEFNNVAIEFTVTMRRSGYNDTETLNFVWAGKATATATAGGILGK